MRDYWYGIIISICFAVVAIWFGAFEIIRYREEKKKKISQL